LGLRSSGQCRCHSRCRSTVRMCFSGTPSEQSCRRNKKTNIVSNSDMTNPTNLINQYNM
jgi:hypothetical protein